MSNHSTRRGFLPEDKKLFGEKAKVVLQKAKEEICYLINRGYPIKNVSTFVGNHYLLSERQRLALVRSISTQSALNYRKEKEKTGQLDGETVYIDGFNQIITLEVALSQSTLLRCMDGTIRDLAGLRGTYHIIDHTATAIALLGKQLAKKKIAKAVFYLDKPVSNSGRLKQTIGEVLEDAPFCVEIYLEEKVDVLLEQLENVITSDAIILDSCKSWLNLCGELIEEELPEVSVLQL